MLLKVLPDAKKDGPFFTVVGLLCGIVQYVGYHYFDKKEWGSELLQEHIAFESLVILCLVLLACNVLLRCKVSFSGREYIKQLTAHLSQRAVAFGLVPAFVILGFAIAAVLFKSFSHGFHFTWASIYFFAIAEMAANLGDDSKPSSGFTYLLPVIITMPFV